MLIDRQNLMSDAQAVTVTAFSTDSIDLGNLSVLRNVGREGLRAIITCSETALAAGAATVDFQIGTADDAAGTNFTPHAGVTGVGKAAITAGSVQLDVPLPDTTKRFLMARYTVGTGPLTAGKFSAELVLNSDHQRYYADGYTQGF